LKLGELIQQTAQRLKRARLHYGHGTDNARDEAAFLVLRGLGLPFDTDLERSARPERVESLIQKRIEERIPAAYLLKEAWLDGVPFYVDRRVIVPRSHIAFLFKRLRVRPKRILDLCTGSGCLAPGLSTALFRAGREKDFARAEELRSRFLPLEDARDAYRRGLDAAIASGDRRAGGEMQEALEMLE